MTYREDKIKVFNLIGAHLTPTELLDYDQEVLLSEKDFEKIGLSCDDVYPFIKELFEEGVLNIIKYGKSKKDGQTMFLKISSNFDIAMKSFKYPETVLSEQEEIMQELEAFPSEINFCFNRTTGEFRYYETSGILSPKSREFTFLRALDLAPNKQAPYNKLVGKTDPVSLSDKDMISETIKVLKRKLGIHTKSKDKKGNPDIIKNISKYGYKLDI